MNKPSWLEPIIEREAKATKGAEIFRYEHGGGRIFVENAPCDLKLVADIYDEANREFIYHAPADVAALLQFANKAYEVVDNIKNAAMSENDNDHSDSWASPHIEGECDACFYDGFERACDELLLFKPTQEMTKS